MIQESWVRWSLNREMECSQFLETVGMEIRDGYYVFKKETNERVGRDPHIRGFKDAKGEFFVLLAEGDWTDKLEEAYPSCESFLGNI